MKYVAEEPDIQANKDLEQASEGMFSGETGKFRGGKCTSCGSITVPRKFICHECFNDGIEPVTVSPAGNLYSHTTLHVSATLETPYTLGYVDLDSGVRVLGHVEVPSERLGCDIAVVAKESSNSPTGWSFTLVTEGTDK